MNKLKKLIASNWTRLKVMLIIRLCLNQKNKKKKNQILRNHLFIQYAKFSKKLRFFSTIRTSAITNVRRKLFYQEKK